jgi:AraC-like DNA-binding protein
MATEGQTIEAIGHTWEAPPDAMLPRIIGAMVVHRRRPVPSNRICLPVWVLDYSLGSLGYYRVNRPSGPWKPRPANEAHLYPPGTPYWEEPGKERRMSSAFVTFHGGEMVGLGAMIRPGEGFARITDPTGILGNAIQEAARMGRDGDSGFLMAQSTLFRIFDLLRRARPGTDGGYTLSDAVGARPKGFAADVRDYLQSHAAEKVTLGRIAHALSVSRSTLTHKYGIETGESPMRTLLRMRLVRAKTLLLKGERLKTIAAHMGFVDECHFSRTFKRVEGVSPRNYLRGMAGDKGRTRGVAGKGDGR